MAQAAFHPRSANLTRSDESYFPADSAFPRTAALCWFSLNRMNARGNGFIPGASSPRLDVRFGGARYTVAQSPPTLGQDCKAAFADETETGPGRSHVCHLG